MYILWGIGTRSIHSRQLMPPLLFVFIYLFTTARSIAPFAPFGSIAITNSERLQLVYI